METVIALAVIAVLVTVAVVTIIRNRSGGKCTGCPYCDGCTKHRKRKIKT